MLPGEMDWTLNVTGVIPEDWALSVHVRDRWQWEVPASYLVTVRESGPLLVHYGVAGRQLLHRCPLDEAARMDVWRSMMAARLLEDGAEGGARSAEWLAVWAYGRSRWVPLDESGMVRTWPVVADLERLVSAEVWHNIKVRRGYLLADLGRVAV